MITQKAINDFFRDRHLLGNIMFVFSLSILLISCNWIVNYNKMPNNLISSSVKSETFQELGFFGNIKQEKWNAFIGVVQSNIAHSRNEPGNLSFYLYQPENGKLQPIWFERFENKAAHHHHKKQDYFKNAIQIIGKSLSGEANSIELSEVEKIPAVVPRVTKNPADNSIVITLFDVKPERTRDFIDAFADATSYARCAKGNVEFNIYRYENNHNQFVLIENWESRTNQQQHQESDYSKKRQTSIRAICVSNPMEKRWLVKDISQ